MTSGDPSARYTTRDLAALTSLSERTVRYYVEEGLLPPPLSRGRGPNFDDSHLIRLRLVQAMQAAGNDLAAIGDYLRELEGELAVSGASFESVLAVWSGRNERAGWVEQWRKRGRAPEHLLRYRVAEGVELLIDAAAAPSVSRLHQILAQIRQAFEGDE